MASGTLGIVNPSDIQDMLELSLYVDSQIKEKTVEECRKKGKKLEVNSREGNIYHFAFSKTKVIMRIPKDSYEDSDRRAFLIGKELNSLRYLIPNFVYTFSQISECSRVTPEETPTEETPVASFQECIQGITLEKALKTLTFPHFLNLFLQILLALEVAQRQSLFCHYDLHPGNIVLRTLGQLTGREPSNASYSYTVVLDNKRYDVKAEKYLPVLIDFGLSSIQIDSKTIGTDEYTEYGIYKFPIQGIDMYKLLYYCYVLANEDLRQKIGILFLFYGSDDPYKILLSDLEKAKKASKEYLKKASKSYVIVNTPLEFVNWIVTYPDLSSPITIKERNVYWPKLGRIKEQGKFPEIQSYILTRYIERLTGRKRIYQADSLLAEKCLLEEDKEYLRIPLPNEFKVRDHANRILSTPLGGDKEVEKLIPVFIAETEFVTLLEPFLQYLYTIRELNLTEFSDFVSDFCQSEQYKLYDKLVLVIHKARRWSETLLLSIGLSIAQD